jgi:hypothetical protein
MSSAAAFDSTGTLSEAGTLTSLNVLEISTS